MKALIVEDDPSVPPRLKPTFTALQHDFAVVTSLQAARDAVQREIFHYALVDLTIPPDEDGDFADKRYGLMLIKELRAQRSKSDFPIIAMTSYVDDGFGMSMQLHEQGVNGCISKSPEKLRQLVDLITHVLNAPSAPSALPGPATPDNAASPKPFSGAERELIIYSDAVTLCGLPIWHETAHDHVRQMLLRLSQKTNGHYDHVPGAQLLKLLGRDASNPIAKPLERLRKKAARSLALHQQLLCNEDDVIVNDGGYHFRPWIKVTVVDHPYDAPAKNSLAAVTAQRAAILDEPLNARQVWVLDQLKRKAPLRLETIARHFKKHGSTIKRDLQNLRARNLIATHPQGYYILKPGTE